MKKMINTLVAVVVAFAIVGNVDARVRQSVKTAPTSLTNASELATLPASQDVKEERIEDVKNMLASEENPDKQALIAQQVKQTDKQAEVNNQKALIAAMPRVGLIWDSRTETEKDARKEAMNTLAQLQTELKDINAEVARLTKLVGAPYAHSTKLAIAALVATGITVAALVDQFVYQGAGRQSMTTKAGRAGAYVSTKAGEAKTAMGTTYRKYAPKRLGGE